MELCSNTEQLSAPAVGTTTKKKNKKKKKRGTVISVSVESNLPAETPCAGRMRSECPSPPTVLWVPWRTARTPASPAARLPSWPTGCRRPSPGRRAAGCSHHPTGCAVSPARPPAHAYLDGEGGMGKSGPERTEPKHLLLLILLSWLLISVLRVHKLQFSGPITNQRSWKGVSHRFRFWLTLISFVPKVTKYSF